MMTNNLYLKKNLTKKMNSERTLSNKMTSFEDSHDQFTSQDFSKNEGQTKKIIKLLDHPWQLITQGGKLGINGVKRFFSILFLFVTVNILLFFFCLYRFFVTDFTFTKLGMVFFVLIIGILITIHAMYRTYRYVLVNAIQVIYENMTPFFYKIVEDLIHKTEKAFEEKIDIKSSHFAKSIDFSKTIHNKYKKSPRLLRKGILLILKRIPFSSLLLEMREDVISGNKQQACEKLFGKMNDFLNDRIFGNNHTRWVYWLLPVNILVIIALILIKLG